MVTLNLTEQQLQALVGLLDAGVRSTGLQSAPGAAELLGLIDQAVKEARARKESTE
jgi:hypothetical protein